MSVRIALTAQGQHAGTRLDSFVSSACDDLSRSAAAALCEKGAVTVNGIARPKSCKLSAGDRVELELPDPIPYAAQPEDIPINVVYEDDDLLVVDKPAGMVVHPAPGNYSGTLVNALLFHCKNTGLSSINGVVRPGIVHRIDKDTSGLLVVAKNDAAHSGLAEQFAVHSIERIYYAVVVGTPKESNGVVDAPIGRHKTDRKRMCITEHNSRRAVTHYTVLERYRGYSLLKLELETGRTHQIRVHMASLGHPLAGDRVYGRADGWPRELTGQCLHAAVLGFNHPIRDEWMRFESPLPDYFVHFLDRISKEG